MEGQYEQKIVDTMYPSVLMYDAMKIWSLPENKKHMLPEICEGGEYFGQIKKDGNWYQFVTAESGSYLFSRTESVVSGLLTEKVKNVPHIQEILKCLPVNTIVIGEIYYPGLTSNEVRSVMGCLSPLAIKRQKGDMGFIKYYIHDIIMFNGVSLMNKGAWDRYNFLKAVFEKLDLGRDGHVELAESFEDNLYERIGNALEAGEEGMVLKRKTFPYVPGKKPAWSAIKAKKVDYADAICMGFEPATKLYEGDEITSWGYWIRVSDNMKMQGCFFGQEGYVAVTKLHYYGWIGSIVIGAYDIHGELIRIGSVSSGLTDALREKIADKDSDYRGQVCMLQLMEKFDGALRHPIFKGFREDKNPKECTLASIFGN